MSGPVLVKIGVGALFVALIAAIGAGFWLMDRSDAADLHRQDRAFERANTICGGPPLRIKTHGSSWNFGPWLEVVCRDGTTRAVRP